MTWLDDFANIEHVIQEVRCRMHYHRKRLRTEFINAIVTLAKRNISDLSPFAIDTN